ncbi:F-box protein [Phanerochaete sordida]|uniref:F-box protein n=1 Tax=Phanerochaete sordida TaxID=48140 RepID=A0A9P3G5M9_9APHY|nr:F-box protein [Phanerochaete sordida]
MAANITLLPSDIVIIFMHHLSARDLAALCCTCRILRDLVDEFGWKDYLKRHPRQSLSLSMASASWSSGAQVKYNMIADHNWKRQHFVARPLSQRWTGKLQPLLTINSSRLLLAAGNTIYSYGFSASAGPDVSPPVRLECAYTTSAFHPNRDITALTSLPDNGSDRTIVVGYADGNLERVTLPPCAEPAAQSGHIDASLRERYDFHDGSLIEGLSVSASHLLSLSSTGTAAFTSLASTELAPELVDVGTRCWSCHLEMGASSPYAAFGQTSLDPLSVHHISESHISPQPSILLSSATPAERSTAVYAISSAPPACAWGASKEILVSGWYDGIVRIFDLRTPTHLSADGAPSLLPCMSICDPWTPEPIYSLSCGGGSASHIAAGSARHSVLAFWDVRAHTRGWSVHAPGNDSSPVYSVVMDGARVFGANESRAFVFDFGPGVNEATYPPVVVEPEPAWRGVGRWRKAGADDGLKRAQREGPGFYVTKYRHSK